MKNIITIFGALLLSWTVSAAPTDPAWSHCMDLLSGKTITVKYIGNRFDVRNLLDMPYEANLSFDSAKNGGQVTIAAGSIFNYKLVVSPFASNIHYEPSLTPFEPIELNCKNPEHVKSCEASAKSYLDELAVMQLRAISLDGETLPLNVEEALFCAREALRLMEY